MQKSVQNNKDGGLVHLDFDPVMHFKHMKLSTAAEKIWSVPNAGGNSVISEVLSFETFHRCFHAKLFKTEMEVSYFPEGGSITDYVCEIFDTKVGVSVTRAMKYRGDFTEEDAHHLLMKKLKGVNQANRNTLEKWNKQILHVWVQNKEVANLITKTFNNLSMDLVSSTVVVISRTRRSDFIFYNP
ncbi:AAC-rich mRNA clone AAC4 protein-like isoform X2 [Saccostrea cucullata]|uniref:AAC-rich mRNA clone AAC4 protein-like isoform X1 n=1 Tax=Saccostrea cuccullata TaxID=36930 RepID=UPI002ED18164